ncbi:TetR/AcrR family transcriptional regulator [soil metagenome]
MAKRNALTKDDWARAALDDIGSGGVDAVTVEGLARRLGVTKGSFYWHFSERAAVLEAALSLWERAATLDIIDELSDVADPRERLSQLFDASFGDAEGGALDAALLSRTDDPVVRPVIDRVHAARIAFLYEAFADLGLPPARAARQARITYASYVGHFVIRRALPHDRHLGRPNRAYLQQLLEAVASRPLDGTPVSRPRP